MRKWILRQLTAEGVAPVVVIDHKSVVVDDEIEEALGPAEVYRVGDWFELRRAWERHGRRRGVSASRLVLVTEDHDVSSGADLPFDIERSSLVRRIRIPGPSAVHHALVAMDAQGDQAVDRMTMSSLTPTDAVLGVAADVPSVPVVGSPAREFQVALRLVGHTQPSAVSDLARASFTDPLALALLSEPPRMEAVQTAWESWLVDPSGCPWDAHMRECRAELIDLFMTGRLKPAQVDETIDVPSWAAFGLAHKTPASRVRSLLDVPPDAYASLDDWVRCAQWWGEVRSGLALVNPTDDDLEAEAWDWWREADEAFLTWLRANYGSQLTRTWANWPASLDKVQPFLAKRHTPKSRLLLVVLDGMGFTQWARIRDLASIQVAQAGGVLAMVPTLTEVSRQAIAAGSLPIGFADSLRSTSREPQRWAASWEGADVSNAWVRIDGARIEELSVVPFDTADVIGLVLSATDELMHSAELLGDIGLHAGLEAWVRSGVLTQVLDRAAEHGYEIWLTADHGNLAVEPAKEPREGAFVERAGTRARRYGSKTLRDGSMTEGIAWDSLPGYPSDESERLLFASGRTGWGPSRLSHGGLSLDEVIVPLVQVESAR